MSDVETITFLWGLLDDIDSQGDACKGDDKAYRSRVERLQKLRWETGIVTDGYGLSMPSGTKLPPRETFRL